MARLRCVWRWPKMPNFSVERSRWWAKPLAVRTTKMTKKTRTRRSGCYRSRVDDDLIACTTTPRACRGRTLGRKPCHIEYTRGASCSSESVCEPAGSICPQMLSNKWYTWKVFHLKKYKKKNYLVKSIFLILKLSFVCDRQLVFERITINSKIIIIISI